jgi:hypothetical protein
LAVDLAARVILLQQKGASGAGSHQRCCQKATCLADVDEGTPQIRCGQANLWKKGEISGAILTLSPRIVIYGWECRHLPDGDTKAVRSSCLRG